MDFYFYIYILSFIIFFLTHTTFSYLNFNLFIIIFIISTSYLSFFLMYNNATNYIVHGAMFFLSNAILHTITK